MNLDAGGGAFLRNARASVLEIASGTRTRIKTDYHGLHGFFIFIIRVIRVFRENPCYWAKVGVFGRWNVLPPSHLLTAGLSASKEHIFVKINPS